MRIRLPLLPAAWIQRPIVLPLPLHRAPCTACVRACKLGCRL
eukprot:COSAG01_NODE_3957_length_5496_cov_3.491199_2_plen_42_part_00